MLEVREALEVEPDRSTAITSNATGMYLTGSIQRRGNRLSLVEEVRERVSGKLYRIESSGNGWLDANSDTDISFRTTVIGQYHVAETILYIKNSTAMGQSLIVLIE